MRHQVDLPGDAQFETIITFESLISKGTDITLQLFKEIRKLSFISSKFSSSYFQLGDSITSTPTVSGAAIARDECQTQEKERRLVGKVVRFRTGIKRLSNIGVFLCCG